MPFNVPKRNADGHWGMSKEKREADEANEAAASAQTNADSADDTHKQAQAAYDAAATSGDQEQIATASAALDDAKADLDKARDDKKAADAAKLKEQPSCHISLASVASYLELRMVKCGDDVTHYDRRRRRMQKRCRKT